MCDEEIIAQVLNGDIDAFSAIVERYKSYIFAIIFNFIKSNDEAENVAQEVFIKIYLSLPQYKKNNFKSWIGRIAVNKAIDYLRAHKSMELPFKDTELVLKADITPEDIYIKEYEKNRLKEACYSLPEIYKNVIYMFYFDRKNYEEIAAIEGVTVRTVESRLYRARKLLRKKWEEEDLK